MEAFNQLMATKNCYFVTDLCRPVSGVSDDVDSPYHPPVVGQENCTYRVVYRTPSPPKEGEMESTKTSSTPKPVEKVVGEVMTWCKTCFKWLATNENPHTKKYHHRFVVLNRTKLNSSHTAIQIMKKLSQMPSKKNKVWAITDSEIDPRTSKVASSAKAASTTKATCTASSASKATAKAAPTSKATTKATSTAKITRTAKAASTSKAAPTAKAANTAKAAPSATAASTGMAASKGDIESTMKRTHDTVSSKVPVASKKMKGLRETYVNNTNEKGMDPYEDFQNYKSSSDESDDEDDDYSG